MHPNAKTLKTIQVLCKVSVKDQGAETATLSYRFLAAHCAWFMQEDRKKNFTLLQRERLQSFCLTCNSSSNRADLLLQIHPNRSNADKRNSFDHLGVSDTAITSPWQASLTINCGRSGWAPVSVCVCVGNFNLKWWTRRGGSSLLSGNTLTAHG